MEVFHRNEKMQKTLVFWVFSQSVPKELQILFEFPQFLFDLPQSPPKSHTPKHECSPRAEVRADWGVLFRHHIFLGIENPDGYHLVVAKPNFKAAGFVAPHRFLSSRRGEA